MTGLESCFEEELARADGSYIDPDRLKIGESAEAMPAPESPESKSVEEAMHLDT